jgi:hypothetical protein
VKMWVAVMPPVCQMLAPASRSVFSACRRKAAICWITNQAARGLLQLARPEDGYRAAGTHPFQT